MKQIQKVKRQRGAAGRWLEALALDPRDPDIVHAHRIARRSSGPDAGRVRSGSPDPAATSSG
jgi:hypothetical protein